MVICVYFFFFFKQKTAYEMRISDWSSDVCSSDLRREARRHRQLGAERMDLIDIMAEYRRGVACRRLSQRFGGDEGIAVAVAADPAPDAQEGRGTRAELL